MPKSKSREATFAGYQIEERVGGTGSEVIYKARDPRLHRAVALRILTADLAADPLTRARLNRESTTLAAIEHPNVLPIYDVGEHDRGIYIANRWVDGVTLSTLVEQHGPLDPVRAVHIIIQVAAALEAVHRPGIMHRNVKPTSVLITDSDHTYLTEFGLARRASDMTGLTVHDQILQTFDYLAPEYISDEQMDRRMDIYGLGCILYESLTGEVPFPRSGHAAKVYAHLSSEPPSARAVRPEVPEPLDAVARRAMAKNPDERQQSAAEFASEAALAVGLPISAWAAGSPSAEARPLPAPAPSPPADPMLAPVMSDAEEGRSAASPQSPQSPQRDLVVARAARPSEPRRVPAGPRSTAARDALPEPVIYGRPSGLRRAAPWVMSGLVFIAAPVALLIALIH